MADKKTFDIFIPKDPYDKAKKQTLYAAVNGEGYYFERGKTHKVSKPFYDVISSSLAAQAKVDERILELENIKM
jgi:hypothetical protein